MKVAEFETFLINATDMQVRLKFEAILPEDAPEDPNLDILLIDKIFLEDRKNNRYVNLLIAWTFLLSNIEIINEMLLFVDGNHVKQM